MRDTPKTETGPSSSYVEMKKDTSAEAGGPFKSCPIRIDHLRNSLQANISSKRQSMTATELEFVQSMIESNDLTEDHLTQLNDALECDKLFFVPGAGETEEEEDKDNRSSSSIFSRRTSDKPEPPKPAPNQRAVSLPVLPSQNDNCNLGSKKRQEKLEARKKQAAAQAKKRATSLWKKASVAAKAIARFSNASATSHQRSFSLPTTATVRESSRTSIQSTVSALTVDESPSEVEDSLKIQGSMLSVPEEGEGDNGSEYEHGLCKDEREEDKYLGEPLTNETKLRPTFLRQASANVYGGEGFEIGTEFIDETKSASDDNNDDDDEDLDRLCEKELEDQIGALGISKKDEGTHHIQTPSGIGFRRASVNIYGGSGFEVATEELLEEIYDIDGGHKVEECYDPWLYQETDEQGRKRTNMKILGTSHDDTECHPHVLSPIQMERLQPYLPDTKKGESFWLKYSLVRDGASPISFLKQVRASPYTLLAMETVDGEVFGGFFTQPWTVQSGYFGSGGSFLWRMKHRRHLPEEFYPSNGGDNDSGATTMVSLAEQIEREADLEVFRSEVFYVNDMFQLCTQDSIASGGGSASVPQDFGNGKMYPPQNIGFGLKLGGKGNSSLLEGSSSACLTYRSPPLSQIHPGGTRFELINLEAWGFTPCQSEEEARILEYKNMFFKRHATVSF